MLDITAYLCYTVCGGVRVSLRRGGAAVSRAGTSEERPARWEVARRRDRVH
jgi:hypothetical protein